MSNRLRRRRGWLEWSAARVVAHHVELGERAPRFQWVWWGWRSWALYALGVWPSNRAPVYRWFVRVGPIELRRWGP